MTLEGTAIEKGQEAKASGNRQGGDRTRAPFGTREAPSLQITETMCRKPLSFSAHNTIDHEQFLGGLTISSLYLMPSIRHFLGQAELCYPKFGKYEIRMVIEQ
jgi:hypothetical protein